MPQTYLNVAGHQRVDLADMQQVAQDTPARGIEELANALLIPQGTGSIIGGFKPYASDASTVTIGTQGIPNEAFLGRRQDGITRPGCLSACAPQSIGLSVSAYPSGTFGIYVRLTLNPVTPQQRVFWDQSGLQEVAQLTPTALQAAWEARIEANPPSSGEWQLIGQAVVTAQGSGSGSTVVVTDQRRLFFEGTVGTATTTTWGSASDRTTDRANNAIGDLQTKLDALTTCIVDIKGRSLVPWYSPYVGGLNIGTRFATTDNPVLERVAVGDANFALQGNAGSPTVLFNGFGAYLSYNRFSNIFTLGGGGSNFSLAGSGYAALGKIPNLINPVQPLTLWSYAPYGRVAQFVNDGNSPAAISIGDTNGNGGRIDFAAPSITDFTSSYWSMRGTFGNAPAWSLVGIAGSALLVQMATGSSYYSTTVQGTQLNLTGTTAITLAANNGNVQTNGLVVNGRTLFQPSLAWLTFQYNSVANSFTANGVPGITRAAYDGGGQFNIDLSTTIPPYAAIFVTCRKNGNDLIVGSYNIFNGNTRIQVGVAANGAGYANLDFNLLILWGS